jgi:hypothetical protein
LAVVAACSGPAAPSAADATRCFLTRLDDVAVLERAMVAQAELVTKWVGALQLLIY